MSGKLYIHRFEVFGGKTTDLAPLPTQRWGQGGERGKGSAGKNESGDPWDLPLSVVTVQPALLLSFGFH